MHTLNKRKFIFDALLIALLLAAAIIAAVVIRSSQGAGESVVVSVDGERVLEAPLDADGEYALADGGNILVIEGGEAYIRSADCPDKLCVNMGRISLEGERIVCLPNRVIVEIVK